MPMSMTQLALANCRPPTCRSESLASRGLSCRHEYQRYFVVFALSAAQRFLAAALIFALV